MKYLSAAETAEKWNLSERSVRNYCALGRVPGAVLTGGKWSIPQDAEKPERSNSSTKRPGDLLGILKFEKRKGYTGGIYHKTQIDLTYNSNHIEGSRLTHDQTRYIFDTNTVGAEGEALNVDDIIETVNHFRCVEYIIDHAKGELTEGYIKRLHLMLKENTRDPGQEFFAPGEYKRLPNEVGGMVTVPPEDVPREMKRLLEGYNGIRDKSLEDIVDLHVRFERIHPFQDGNGRVGRMIMFRECLKYGIVPFIIDDDMKLYYYRGLKEWDRERGYLLDTCLAAQDKYKKVLEYFRIG